jgi:hypothetical protein
MKVVVNEYKSKPKSPQSSKVSHGLRELYYSFWDKVCFGISSMSRSYGYRKAIDDECLMKCYKIVLEPNGVPYLPGALNTVSSGSLSHLIMYTTTMEMEITCKYDTRTELLNKRPSERKVLTLTQTLIHLPIWNLMVLRN